VSLDVDLHESSKVTCPHCTKEHEIPGESVWSRNITHNLTKIASEAGIYEAMWRPYQVVDPAAAMVGKDADEAGQHETARRIEDQITVRARDLEATLSAGLARLQDNPAHYAQWEPANKWGSVRGLIEFVTAYLNAIREYPDAIVSVSR
jgi:hypothetical protein